MSHLVVHIHLFRRHIAPALQLRLVFLRYLQSGSRSALLVIELRDKSGLRGHDGGQQVVLLLHTSGCIGRYLILHCDVPLLGRTLQALQPFERPLGAGQTCCGAAVC